MILDLITDRTQADVDYAALHKDSAIPLKGAYNSEDFNRVGKVLNYLIEWLFSFGYGLKPNPLLKENWSVFDNFTPADGAQYLTAVQQLKAVYFILPSTPPLPKHIHELFYPGGYEKANDIERILHDIEWLINRMIEAFHYSNQFYSGERVEIAGYRFARRLTVGELEKFTVAQLEKFTIDQIEFGEVG